VFGQDSPDDVLVEFNVEYERQLVRDALVAEVRISALYFAWR
jgi:hypothetical protein